MKSSGSPAPESRAGFRPEDRLLRLCADPARFINGGTGSGELPAEAGFDWDYFLFQAAAHGIIVPAARYLEKYAQGLLPPDLKINFEEKADAVRKKNIRLSGELVRILEAFGRKGIQAFAYKGPVLDEMIYGEIGVRQFDDLDLMIIPEDLDQAEEVMANLGYHSGLSLTPRQRIEYIRRECELGFFSGTGHIHVEIHWRLLPEYLGGNSIFGLPETWSGSWEPSRCVPEIPAEAMLVLIVAHHGFKHFFDKLSWLSDIKGVIIKSEMDWNSVIRIAAEAGVQKMLYTGLYLTRELLGLQLPENLIQPVSAAGRRPDVRKMAAQYDEKTPAEPPVVKTIHMHLMFLDSWKQKIRYLVELGIRPSIFDWQAVAIPDPLFFLYYLTRPFRLGWKQLKRIFILNRAKPSTD